MSGMDIDLYTVLYPCIFINPSIANIATISETDVDLYAVLYLCILLIYPQQTLQLLLYLTDCTLCVCISMLYSLNYCRVVHVAEKHFGYAQKKPHLKGSASSKKWRISEILFNVWISSG